MEFITFPTDRLIEWDKNPRSISPENFEQLKVKLFNKKQFKPLLVTPNDDNKFIVLAGNMRLKAYRDLGVKDLWVSILTFEEVENGEWKVILDGEEQKERFKTKDDAMMDWSISENERAGQYDMGELANVMGNYNLDWSQYTLDALSPKNIPDLLKEFGLVDDVIEDESPEVDNQNEPESKLGEVYQLGRHRLMCGDATKIEDVEKLMNGQKADMVFTDPPYGVSYEGKTKDKLTIQNDENTDVFAQALPNIVTLSKGGASFYVCCPPGNNFKDFFLPFEEYCHLSATIIWAKNQFVLGHGDYHYQHEPILYGWNKNDTHSFYGDRSQTTIWNIDRPSSSLDHPTMKPIELIVKAINNSSKGDDIVLDVFGGSGSTLIASEQTNRNCYMMELDPKYCDVIRKRYAKFINKEDSWQDITPAIQGEGVN